MKISNKTISRLKEELQRGELSSTLELLANITAYEELCKVRQQKLLFKSNDLENQRQLVLVYKEAVNRVMFDDPKREQEINYADFTIIVTTIFSELTKDFKKAAEPIRAITPQDLLLLGEQLGIDLYEEIHKKHAQLEKVSKNSSPLHLSDVHEYSLHEFNGEVNDVFFALCRTLNITYPLTNKRKSWSSSQVILKSARKALEIIIPIASYWHALEYVLDNVTYDEWFVKDIYQSPLSISFDITDVTILRARTIGIRRELIQRFYLTKKTRRMSRDIFSSFVEKITYEFIKLFESSYGVLSISKQREIYKQGENYILSLGIEDDLLIVAAIKSDIVNIIGHYAGALAIRCYVNVERTFKQSVSKSQAERIFFKGLPISQIKEIAFKSFAINTDNANELKSHIDMEVESQIISLPTSHFFELQKNPFIRIDTNKIFTISSIADSNWSTHLRTRLVRGDEISRFFGAVTEEYITYMLQENGWTIIGTGINIKRTDIDVLAFKNELLLIIQIKAIGRGGMNTFEHWKSRETLKKGAVQAEIAREELINRANLLLSLLSSKRIKESISFIQPLVVTTSALSSGWVYKNVPIIGIASLKSLLRGAKVEIINRQDSSVTLYNFATGEDLTSQEYLDFFKEPLEWKIALESNEVDHLTITLPQITLNIPILKRSNSLPSE